jgi:hypothetical protein
MKLKLILSSLLILTLLAGCSKEEENFGTVSIFFANKPSDLVVEIFTVENMSIPIYTGNVTEQTLKLPLNFGNYVVKPYAMSVAIHGGIFTQVGFQLNPAKKNVNIHYDEHRGGHVVL